MWKCKGRATVTHRAARRLRGGHLWVYRSDVIDPGSDEAGFVEVFEEPKKKSSKGPGRSLGVAMLSPASTITLRMVDSSATFDDALRATLRNRMTDALARRRHWMPEADAFRWIHGEADGLPGVFVDRYGDCVTVQSACAAADAIEPFVLEVVAEAFDPRALVVRDDLGARAREGLPKHVTVHRGDTPVVARYHEGTVEVEIDLENDQKTGAFLDQTSNHLRAADFARGKGLDCFTYHGGFALQLASGCDDVIACDQSQDALGRAEANAHRAGLDNLSFLRANVFDLLRDYEADRRRFDTIVLDPPAFAAGKHTIPKALKAYKEINLRAMKLLNPGGILISCSCSGRVTPSEFDTMLEHAAADARRSCTLLERRGAGMDHPVLLGMPETEYLKCRILTVA